MVIGHARTCLKNNIVTEYGTRTPKHKQMTFVKRENCTVEKCFKTEYEFRQSIHGILFRHFSYKVVKRCCSVH